MTDDAVDISPETLETPVEKFWEAVPLLRRPFTAEAVHWKVQASFRKCQSALIVPYIDARLVSDRLDIVCGENWQEGDPEKGIPAYQEGSGGLFCTLIVFGVPRGDLGSGYQGKGLYSDAFKRAGVKFGIGRSLYAFPKTILDVDEHGLLEKRTITTKKGPKDINVLTAAGLDHIRGVYKLWLEQVGVHAFGRPLDHGDRGVTTGDVEAEGLAGADEPESEEESPTTKEGKTALQRSLTERAEQEKGDGQ